MPVQDDNKHKKEDFFYENDEDKRRQAVQTSQENSVKKSQKLLPILSTKAEIHQNRINTLTEKIAVRVDKIARNETKIEKLTAKADRLEDRNTIQNIREVGTSATKATTSLLLLCSSMVQEKWVHMRLWNIFLISKNLRFIRQLKYLTVWVMSRKNVWLILMQQE